MLKYILINVIETLMRWVPIQYKRTLIKIGTPDRNSPVFLTCNYHLTVERLKRVLRGVDCYILPSNSRGFNVWCGATGGHFNNHSVISSLKTSGIEKLVDHRNIILPQLSAAGIEKKVIKEKIGWKVIWGPVYAGDIPEFIENGFRKTLEMREVKFPLVQRIEMGVMWAFPFSMISGLIAILLFPGICLPLVAFIWLLSLLMFLSFPLYTRWLNPERKNIAFSRYSVIFDFSRLPLIFWGCVIIILVFYSILSGEFSTGFIFRWCVISLIFILLISIDLMGSTPVYKSGLHKDRFLKVYLDEKKCKGAGFCEQVCPKNCFNVDVVQHIARITEENRCVRCGACIIQCPFDALCFKSPEGKFLPPENIRKFKLNLFGKRLKQIL
ncbi:copper oxidase [candidate division KSB1 bacterium]|nr:MAG: copper oxidase [candidate division KSB1 bacterium]